MSPGLVNEGSWIPLAMCVGPSHMACMAVPQNSHALIAYGYSAHGLADVFVAFLCYSELLQK